MHKFNPEHTSMLISGERQEKMRPEALLSDAGLKKGDTFADIGCGPGFFTFPGAGIVGPAGRVYALDTEVRMIRELEKRTPPENVAVMKSEENKIPVEAGTVDFALLAYVLHEAEDKDRFLKEIKRILRPGAIFVVLDWKKKAEEQGPPVHERLAEEDVASMLRAAGFALIRAKEINESHYMVGSIRPKPPDKGNADKNQQYPC